MQITLDFGRTPLTVDLPDSIRPTIVRKPAMDLPADPGGAIAAALDAPTPLRKERRLKLDIGGAPVGFTGGRSSSP